MYDQGTNNPVTLEDIMLVDEALKVKGYLFDYLKFYAYEQRETLVYLESYAVKGLPYHTFCNKSCFTTCKRVVKIKKKYYLLITKDEEI
tara:strand:- start:1117 stop:1383 length:267 start_codon:yes stop_codon:yes gene_type:complete